MNRYRFRESKGADFLILICVGFLCCVFEGCATSPVRPAEIQAISHESGIYHEVRKGETLFGIARSYGVSAEELIRANRIPDPSKLGIGQLLYIPGRKIRSLPEKK